MKMVLVRMRMIMIKVMMTDDNNKNDDNDNKNDDRSHLGKMFAGAGSRGPGTMINLLCSINMGNSHIKSARSRNNSVA